MVSTEWVIVVLFCALIVGFMVCCSTVCCRPDHMSLEQAIRIPRRVACGLRLTIC
jgi:hypothetical protein